jgi:hypothetical protein
MGFSNIHKLFSTMQSEASMMDDKTPLQYELSVSLCPSWKILMNRVFLCIFAILMLWTTTLKLASDITKSYIATPEIDYVISTCSNSWQYAENQRNEFQNCATRQSKVCDRQLHTSYTQEVARVKLIKEKNAKILEKIQNYDNLCMKSWKKLQLSLKTYFHASSTDTAASNVVPPLVYNTNICSSKELLEIKVKINDNSATLTSKSNQLVDYSQRSDSKVSRIVQHVLAVNTYNDQYVSNKTQKLQDLSRKIVKHLSDTSFPGVELQLQQLTLPLTEVRLCIDNSTSTPCSLHTLNNAIEVFEDTQRLVNAQINIMQRKYSDLLEEVESFQNAVGAALADADAFYDSIQGAAGIMKYIGDSFQIFSLSGEICGKSTPDWCSFTKQNWIVPAILPSTLPSITGLPDASVLLEGLGSALEATEEEIKEMASNTKTSLKTILNSIDESIEMNSAYLPTDYDPPKYPYASNNVTLEEKSQMKDSRFFRGNISNVLSSTSVESTGKTNNTKFFESYVARPVQSLSSALLSSFQGEWAIFNPGAIDTKTWFAAFATVQSYLFFFDYAYRAVQTVYIIRKHWNNSAGKLPPIDLRATKSDLPLADQFRTCTTYFSYIGVQMVIFLLIIVVIIRTLALVYMNSYQSYTETCVLGARNSTYIMRNLNSLSYNYASFGGNREISEKMSLYNKRSQEICTNNRPETQRNYEEHYNTLHAHNTSIHNNVANMDLVRTCLNREQIDSYFLNACCHSDRGYQSHSQYNGSCAEVSVPSTDRFCPIDEIDGEAQFPPSHHLDSQNCKSEISTWPMEDHVATNFTSEYMGLNPTASNPIFNCKAMPTCEITCTGPDRSVLSAASQSCSCVLEWYIHSHLFRAIVVTSLFGLLNLSRIIIIKGLLMSMWKSLNVRIFDCTLSCTDEGTLISEQGNVLLLENGKMIDNSSQKNPIAEATSRVIRRHILMGILLVAIGVLINLIWVLFLPTINGTLAYNPHIQPVEY